MKSNFLLCAVLMMFLFSGFSNKIQYPDNVDADNLIAKVKPYLEPIASRAETGKVCEIIKAQSEHHVDLSSDENKELIDQAYAEKEGTYVLTTKGVFLYQKDELKQSWLCKAQKGDYLIPKLKLVNLDDSIIRLHDDGTTEQLASNVVYSDYEISTGRLHALSLKDGILRQGYACYPEEWDDSLIIATNVKAISVKLPILYRTGDGMVFILNEDSLQYPLGVESFAYYRKKYKEYGGFEDLCHKLSTHDD